MPMRDRLPELSLATMISTRRLKQSGSPLDGLAQKDLLSQA
jgi:hypothetical protein